MMHEGMSREDMVALLTRARNYLAQTDERAADQIASELEDWIEELEAK